MSINNLNTYLNVRDAHLRVVSGNVYAQAMNIGGINVETAHGLQSVSNTGNATSLTLEFANVTTGFVTTANAQIGRDLVVTGNATVSKELTVTSNAIVSSNLNVSDDLIVTNNILASNNLTVTGNLNVTTIRSDSNVVAEYTGPHDRPLRKYPEVAMTQNDESATSGYVASASSTATYDTNLQPENAFNGVISPSSGTASWQSSDSGYSGTTPFNYLNSGTHTVSLTDTDGTVHYGDWLSLQTPNRIKVSYYKIHTLNDVDNYRPDSFVLLGSNSETDGTWKLLHTETNGMTDPGPEVYTGHVNSTEFYTYHRLLVKSLAGNGGEAYINELEYYGYEEGSGSLDTTLKSVYNVPATTGTQLEVYYDAKNYTSGTITDESPNSYVGTLNGNTQLETVDGIKAFTFDGNGDTITGTISGASGEYVHSIVFWVKFEDLVATANQGYTLFEMGPRAQDEMIGLYAESDMINYYFYSNDNSYVLNGVSFGNLVNNQWYQIAATYSGGSDISNRKIYINGNEIARTTHGGASSGPLSLTNGNFTIGDISGGGGSNDFKGSIANFRLYSKALNAGQVQELYDFQKDYFLGSKSQLTLYKGHLGVGVTEPSGQLELAGDERLQEYPPGPMDDYETLIPGHGVFCIKHSGHHVSGPILNAFNKKAPVGDFWYSDVNTYGGANNLYSGSDVAPNGVSGEWMYMTLPYHVDMKYLQITARNGEATSGPKSGIIFGSADGGITWDQVGSWSDKTSANHWLDGGVASPAFTISSTKPLNVFGFVVTHGQGSYAFTLGEIRFYGTPGPTTLDKGSLSLTRSLDVPRVSRYDVDTETPRPEKLVVYFDTTVNKSPTDLSGRRNHGLFNNMTIGTEYSVAEKAFDFTDPNGVIYSGPLSPPMTGDKICSMSAWFKTTNASTVNQSIMWLGAYSVAGLLAVTVSNGALRMSIGSGCSLDVAGVIESNKWYHVVGIKQGTGSITSSNFSSIFKLYLNGEPVTGTFGGTARTLNVTTNYWYVGAGAGAGYEAFSGYISNPILYDTILEPSEIKKLYKLGRTGRSMVITDTAVGIGQAPTAQLDVRGSARFDTFTDMLRIDHPGSQLSIGRSDDNKNEFRWYAWGNGCNWFTPFTGKSIYVGRDGQTISEFDFFNVTTVKRGSSIISSSDDRLKRDEAFITNATDTLLKLKPQIYIKKHRLPENENENSDDIPEQLEAGLIAQDVWYDAPELKFLVHPSKDANPSETKPVSPDPNDPTQDPDYSSWGTTQAYINYEGLIPYLIKATQEQYEKTQSMKSELNLIHELQNENTRLKNKVAILENRQTHFNTLLVNLTGRIETLERGA